MREKSYYCPKCMVNFKIIVEPDVFSEEEIKKNYPDSLIWLDNAGACPECGEELEDIE